MFPETASVLVTHYHRSGNRFYVILKSGKDLWVDDIYEPDTLKR